MNLLKISVGRQKKSSLCEISVYLNLAGRYFVLKNSVFSEINRASRQLLIIGTFTSADRLAQVLIKFLSRKFIFCSLFIRLMKI
jgi:hypothetical protein